MARGLRDGNREAWAKLYEAYSADVWRYVARLVGPPAAEVIDIVQETFLAAARSASQFNSERGTLWSWLAGIAHHQATLAWRQVARTARLRQAAEAGRLSWRNDDNESFDTVLHQRELADLVRGVLTELPADYATLLIGKYLDEQSLEDLSRQSSASLDAVKSKLARARREFRATFVRLTGDTTPLVREERHPI